MRVVINGAGIAGPCLAYWLLRSGHEVVLVEQAPRLRTGGYIIDFWGVGYDVAERMGILPQVLEAGYQVQEVRMVDGHGSRVGGFATASLQQAMRGRLTSLPRGELAAILYGAIEGRVETLFGNSIAGLEKREEEVVVSFAHGPSRPFDLVVGADGLHSAVRTLAFGPEEPFEVELGYHVAAFELAGYPMRDELVYVAYSKPGRQVARFSLRGDRTLCFFIVADEHLPGPEPHTPAERKASLRSAFEGAGWECREMLSAMDSLDDIYFDRVSQIRMPQWSRGRVVLLGDAAACVSLLAGEGTGLAMASAYVLAGELHRAGDDIPTALRAHEERLRSFLAAKQTSAARFASAFCPKTWLRYWLRHQATKLMAIPALADYFLGRQLRDEMVLPGYEM